LKGVPRDSAPRFIFERINETFIKLAIEFMGKRKLIGLNNWRDQEADLTEETTVMSYECLPHVFSRVKQSEFRGIRLILQPLDTICRT
jgi:hypothetical protein